MIMMNMRMLHYPYENDKVSDHIDLTRTDSHIGYRSTHTFFYYI